MAEQLIGEVTHYFGKARVAAIEEGNRATVELLGNRRSADLTLVDDVNVGDFVLLHAGFAIQKLAPEDAAETLALLEELGEEVP